jgi:hypothetical protein
MRTHLTLALAATVVMPLMLAAAPAADAQTRGPAKAQTRTDAPRPHFRERIRAGVKAGQLDRAEVQRLHQSLRGLRAEAHRLRKEGLTRDERLQLRHDRGRVNRQIHRLRHNR